MSQKEILTINIGECGINLGNTVWEQYCAEHDIDNKGDRKDDTDKHAEIKEDQAISSFFDESKDGTFIARNLMIDTDPNVINHIKCCSHSKLYDPEYLLYGQQDAGNNFARGYYTIGREMIDKINDKIRKVCDSCDNLQGFIINHSVAGGTGSGLGSLIFESLSTDYNKKSKVCSLN